MTSGLWIEIAHSAFQRMIQDGVDLSRCFYSPFSDASNTVRERENWRQNVACVKEDPCYYCRTEELFRTGNGVVALRFPIFMEMCFHSAILCN